MYKGLLVTLDGSVLSEAILPVVANLVVDGETVVTLLRVAELPQATVEEPPDSVQPFIFVSAAAPAVQFSTSAVKYAETKTQAIERRESEVKAYLEQLAEALRARGIEVRTVVQFGDAAERIIEYARRPEIEAIAMATHGHTGLRSVIFGSVAGKVLFSGVRPVIMTRPQSYDRGWVAEGRSGRSSAPLREARGER